MEIHTARLTLGALHPGDADALFCYRADPRVSRYQGWCPASVDEARAFIDGLDATALGQPGAWFQRAIRLRETGALIGDVGLHFVADADATVELGVSLSPAHQRKGFATEALRVVLAFVFETMGKHRVTASVDPRNGASLRLLERVGMRREGCFRECLRVGDGWVDEMVYAMLEREWQDGEASGRHRS